MTEKDEAEIWVDVGAIKELRQVDSYLEEHGIFATNGEIIEAAITLAKPMGVGNWSFVCELRHRRE